MSELNIEAVRELPEYASVREEFELAAKLRGAFCVDSAMLNVEALLRAVGRAPVSTPQQSAQRASVNTLSAIADSIECDGLVRTAAKLREEIAHINAWGSAGSGATQSSAEDA